MRKRYSFWVMALAGCLLLGAAVLLFDLPGEIARGEQGRVAIQMLDEMRRPLLGIEQAEADLLVGRDRAAAVDAFEAAATQAEALLARYRQHARYNPVLADRVQALAVTYHAWLGVERHLFTAEPAHLPLGGGTHLSQHLLESAEGFLSTLNRLGEGEHPIHADIEDGKQAVVLLFGLIALLFVYLGGLTLWQQTTKARVLARTNRELERLRVNLEQHTRGLTDLNTQLGRESTSLQLLQAVTAAANEATTVDEALLTTIRRVCAHTGWPVGHAYRVTRGTPPTLVPTGLWNLDDRERFGAFRDLTETTCFGDGIGLPGRVLRRREPAWIVDATRDPNFPRAQAAARCGLRSGFAFPVLIGSRVVAVLEFFTAGVQQPDAALLDVMANVGTQLGRVVERSEAEERLQRLTHYDPLTGLPNRTLFADRLRQSIARAQRHDARLAVLYLDLDRFKGINDARGHDAGDELLQAVGQRLLGTVRAGDTVARLGGDEFVIIYEEIGEGRDLHRLAQGVLDALARPFVAAGEELFTTASIGISLFPPDGQDASTLLRCADIAMYRAKEKGKNNFQFYSAVMGAQESRRQTLETQLRHALKREEFVLHYQPKVSLHTGAITGAEALLRWRHPESGLVVPGEFIPLLEETGLIVPVGAWVLREACAQAAAWRRAGHLLPHVAVNLSARQFLDREVVTGVTRALRASTLGADGLQLEITESVLMARDVSLAAALEELDAMGIQLVVDDFGTGYSSLQYLRRFPVRAVKVDRSFVQDVSTDANDAAITRTVIAMARGLHMTAIAEGVETAAQLDFLRANQCDEIQGFYFSRPLPAEEFEALLREDRRLPGIEPAATVAPARAR